MTIPKLATTSTIPHFEPLRRLAERVATVKTAAAGDTFERGSFGVAGGAVGGSAAFAPTRGITGSIADTLSTRLLVAQASNAGLTQAETAQLQTNLEAMPSDRRRQEVDFLRQDVIGTPNADRALRTYNELQTIQAEPGNAARLDDDRVHDLTRAVAEPSSAGPDGAEGVMGQTQAVQAAQTLTELDDASYQAIDAKLDASTSSTERALVLKATGARREELSGSDEARTTATGDITRFADEIAGTPRDELIARTSTIDVDGDGSDEGLRQRYTDSCVVATGQAVKGAEDPIYAWDREGLQGDLTERSNPYDDVGMEQRTVLEGNGGEARPRGAPGDYAIPTNTTVWPDMSGEPHDVEIPDAAAQTAQTTDLMDGVRGALLEDRDELGIGIRGRRVDDALNDVNGKDYDRTEVGSTRRKQAAVDDAAERLARGEDVPIGVAWEGGGKHLMLLTDVRGEAGDRQFRVYDPANGGTSWIAESELTADKGNYQGLGFELTDVWTEH